MSPLLQAEGLALAGRLAPTSIALAPGQLTCLVGPNGSGKTSLLHALAGIHRPAGHVMIDDTDLRAAAPARRMRLLAYLPASRDLPWPLVGRDLIALGGAEPGAVERWIGALELQGVADRRVDQLSTGERSRIMIARALAPAPRVLLLDEPIANLDPLWQLRLMEMLREQLSGTGQAALIAMHDLDAAARYGGRLIIMNDGRIAADGEPGTLMAGPELRSAFGIEKVAGAWRPIRQERPRSSP